MASSESLLNDALANKIRSLTDSIPFNRRARRVAAACGLFFLAIIALFYAQGSASPHYITPADRLRPANINGFQTTAKNVRLLVPSINVTADLCKTILTSHILGYSSPILVNFGRTFNHASWNDGGFHIGKIEGVAAYLKQLAMHEDGDLILVADAADTWFQLRVETLLSRYRVVNERLYQRTISEMGKKAAQSVGVTQGIIFGAQKDCGSPKGWDDVACFAQPESTLARNTYGPGTDLLDPQTHLPTKFRPHWLNSGMIMGPAFNMRAMFNRALDKVSTSNHNGSDLQIFSEIFGEQQYQRELAHGRLTGGTSRFMTSLSKVFGIYRPSMLDAHPTRKSMDLIADNSAEFGIGIDYALEMVFSTVLSEFDGDWFLFGNKADTRYRQVQGGHRSPRLSTVPKDVTQAGHPYQMLLSETPDDVTIAETARLTWDEVPLYANVWTGTIPAVIHLNGFDGMKSAIWHRMWYHDELRHLHTIASGLGADTPIGWVAWHDLGCGSYEDEIFPVPKPVPDLPDPDAVIEAEVEAVAESQVIAEAANNSVLAVPQSGSADGSGSI